MNWYALYVHSRSEKKVTDRLLSKGIEAYCPLKTVWKQWSDRKKKVDEPFFRSYVFVRMADSDRVAVLQTAGVVRLVYWLGRPAIIRDTEMREIRAFFAEYDATAIVSEDYKTGQELSIARGPFKGRKGIVMRQNKQYVILRMPELGMIFSVKKQDVETA